MTERTLISSGSKWEPLLGYSRAVKAGPYINVSGTMGVNPDGSAPQGMYAQAKRALEIIADAISQAGAEMKHVVRTRMFVTDVSKLDEIIKAHGEIFSEIRPATTVVEVAKLVDPAYMIEIEAEAII